MDDLFDPEVSAREAARRGMERAADHADREHPGPPPWRELAFRFWKRYAATHALFMTEDARVYAEQNGLPPPPDKRAWGQVAVRSYKEGVTAKDPDHFAHTKVKPANAGLRPVWRSLICGGVEIVS